MSAIGEWNAGAKGVDIILNGINPPRIILTVAMSNQSREEVQLVLVKTDDAGKEFEIPVATWSNCLPTVRSFVTPLGPPINEPELHYRVRAWKYPDLSCGEVDVVGGTAPVTSKPVGFPDPAMTVSRWMWDFGHPAALEKAYIAIMIVDDNVGGGK